jgi:hypothetical protein
LVDQRLGKDVKPIPSKFIEASGAVEIIEAFVKERVPETGYTMSVPPSLH